MRTRTAITAIARAGFVAKGLVYLMVGLLTMQTTIGMRGETSDATDALRAFINQPFGSVLLTIIIVGLIAHALWKLIRGVKDPENRGSGAKIALLRTSDVLIGFLYIGMSYAAFQILRGLNAADGDETTKVWVERVLHLPFGRWLVMVAAGLLLIGGLVQFYSSWKATFESEFSEKSMSKTELGVVRWLGRIGVAAWGVVYCMMAFLFYRASVNFDAEEAGGLSDALTALREQPYGIWILGIMAGGMIIYGIYLLALSYYHKVFEEGLGGGEVSDRSATTAA